MIPGYWISEFVLFWIIFHTPRTVSAGKDKNLMSYYFKICMVTGRSKGMDGIGDEQRDIRPEI